MVSGFHRRRATTWAMLVLQGLVSAGLPLPLGGRPGESAPAAATAAKDRSRPFPCMDRPCGCDSAERCFSNCCCHSPAETLAWARARGLDPAVIATLARRATAVDHRAAEATARSCCLERDDRPSCCAAQADEAACCDVAAAGSPPAGPAPPDADPAPHGLVVLRAMLACGGIVAQWTAIGGSLPPPRPVEVETVHVLRGWVDCRDESPVRLSFEPAEPPPRGC